MMHISVIIIIDLFTYISYNVCVYWLRAENKREKRQANNKRNEGNAKFHQYRENERAMARFVSQFVYVLQFMFFVSLQLLFRILSLVLSLVLPSSLVFIINLTYSPVHYSYHLIKSCSTYRIYRQCSLHCDNQNHHVQTWKRTFHSITHSDTVNTKSIFSSISYL